MKQGPKTGPTRRPNTQGLFEREPIPVAVLDEKCVASFYLRNVFFLNAYIMRCFTHRIFFIFINRTKWARFRIQNVPRGTTPTAQWSAAAGIRLAHFGGLSRFGEIARADRGDLDLSLCGNRWGLETFSEIIGFFFFSWAMVNKRGDSVWCHGWIFFLLFG